MAVSTEKYIRKPLYVDAVRITAQNFDDIVSWCQGEVQHDEVPHEGTTKKYIKVRVHNPKNPRQTKAFIGDWLLYTERGYKVYTNKAFHASFDLAMTQKAPPDGPAYFGMIQGVPTDDGSKLMQGAEELAPGLSVNQAVARLREAGTPENGGVTPIQPEKVQPSAAEGKRVLSAQEQRELSSDEIRELVQTGEVVLAQDIAQP